MSHFIIFLLLVFYPSCLFSANFPVVINTWAFTDANSQAWETLSHNGSALDAIQKGAEVCEEMQCGFTVGYGGSPDEKGETTLDAMIMDGMLMDVGAVAGMRKIKSAIEVARHVMENTRHSLLVGDGATNFATQMGYVQENLTTNRTQVLHKNWIQNKCQPNFWENVAPDPKTSCGPYHLISSGKRASSKKNRKTQSKNPRRINHFEHDTIGIVAIDIDGNVAAGTSSNGATYKIPGRVGDSPLPGAGAYADGEVGGAAATGDGDVMMRFLPSFLAVEEMRRGATPLAAAETAINRIVSRITDFAGGIVVLRKDGKFAGACHNIDSFPFTVSSDLAGVASVYYIKCT